MKNILLIYLFLFICSEVSFPQIITNYKETSNQILMDLKLESVPFEKVKEREEIIVQFKNYADISNPGDYALPSREIIIALPSYSKIAARLESIGTNRIEGKPMVNPSAELKEDGTVIYNKAMNKNSSVKKAPVEVMGYLWIKGYYCAHLKINQYQFNSNIIEEINKGRLVLNVLSPGNNLSTAKYESNNDHSYLSSVIANYNYAVSLNKQFYEPAAMDYGWIDFSKTYVKLGTNIDKIYRITKADLDALGVNVSSINSSTFSIFLKGHEIPITVKDNGNGQLDDSGYIEFIGKRNMGDPNYREISQPGESYKEYLDRYSDTSVYWLTWGGNPGLRADSLSRYTGIPTDTLLYYSQVVHYEDNIYLDYSMSDLTARQLPQWKRNQTWVEGQQQVGTLNRRFTATDIFPNKTAKAFYKIQDYSSEIVEDAHKVGISINNDPTVYDSLPFNKFEQKVVKAEFNSNLLVQGNNTLKAISYPTSAILNSIEVDWYEIEYPRFSKSVNDSLILLFNDITSAALKYVKISNFNGQNPVIYKMTRTMKRITNFTRSADVIVFADSVSPGDKYIILDQSKISKPYYFYKKNFTDLASANNRADYILITHPSFLQAAGQYLSFIEQTYNLTTKVVNVFDIYDQFNYGFFSPEPIRDFLKTANQNWQNPKPQYLFLVGDANYDYYSNKYKYFQNPKVANLVPSYGEPVSDTWYVIWDSTGALIPQMYIGRVPAGDVAEFNHFFDKHKQYVNEPFDDWNKYYLFFSSGKGDDMAELQLIKRINDTIISKIVAPPPVAGIAHHLYKTFNPRTNFGPYTPEQINDMIGLGGVFTCYIGHSGTQVWDNGINDVRQLHNTRNKHSLYSDFGCSTGKFAEPDIKAFGELFVNGPDGEAIGYTGNSSLGFLSNLPELFYTRLLKDTVLAIGVAHSMAKIDLLTTYGSNTTNKVFMYENTLFSDPVIRLKVPEKPNLNISAKDISMEREFIDDSMDSVGVKAIYFNYGSKTDSSFNIKIKLLVNGIEKNTYNISRVVPGFMDSVLIYIPVKGSVGIYTLNIKVDSNDDINEIYENDNEASFTFNVASNAARLMTTEYINNLSNGKLRIVNPAAKTVSDSLLYEVSANPYFTNAQVNYKKLDTVYTKLTLSNLQQGNRYWFRTKLNSPDSEYGTVYSFIFDSTALPSFFVGDTVSYKTLSNDALEITPTGIQLSQFTKDLKVISAGTYDGSFAVIEINGNNYLPDGHLDGIQIAVFKDTTLEFVNSGRFSYWYMGEAFYANLYNFLNAIPSGRIVAFAMSSAALVESNTPLPDSVKNLIKSFGSVYVDSIRIFHSWALIGKKGALPGTMPELWKRPYGGSVTVDSIFTLNQNNGTLVTTEFGPVKNWKTMNTGYTVFNGSNITFQPLGIKADGTADTLQNLNIQNGIADLSSLSSYNKLKFIIRFSRSNNTVPVLKNIKIGYDPVDEVGTNYQVVSLQTDSVMIGSNINIKYKVYNCGFSGVDSFKVKLEKVKPDNSREQIVENTLPYLPVDSSTTYSVDYNTASGSGPANFTITIDPENKLKEFFKDNNIYSVPFFVKADTSHPSISLTFNGVDISDGEYISANPLIRIELNDPSLLPITNDTAAITLTLNGQPVYYLNNTEIHVTLHENNPKVILEYKPTLKDGEYVLNVKGQNSLGAIADSAGIEKRFVVNQEPKLLNVFNYPNPFKESTWFTFKLTQIPDEIRIRIFTIAGRLIKEINTNGSELKYDFNKIFWDGKDQDGDKLANGVYFYKIIMKKGDKTESLIQKTAVLR